MDDSTECVTDLDYESNFTTFKLSVDFLGNWGSIENWLKPKIEPPSGNLACPNP